MRHIMFDIETLDVESSAVVLSIGFIEFQLDERPVYQELVQRGHFFKLEVTQQVKEFHRTIKQDTLNWWSKQSKITRDISLLPKADDLPLIEGIEKIRLATKCQREMKRNFGTMFWQRGGFDQIVFESLCRSTGIQPFTHFSNWRDVRTALDVTVENCVHGYAPVPWLDQDTVHKHDPVADCAYDICQLLVNNGKPDEVNLERYRSQL